MDQESIVEPTLHSESNEAGTLHSVSIEAGAEVASSPDWASVLQVWTDMDGCMNG